VVPHPSGNFSETPGSSGVSTPTLNLKIDGVSRRAIVDTGSAISVLNTSLWKNQLPETSPWRLRSANGDATALYGPVNMVYQIQDRTVTFPTFISDISDEFLLGADFLRTFNCTVDLGTQELYVTLPDGSSRKLQCSESPKALKMRRLVRTVRTPSVVVVSANEGVNLDYYPSAGRGPWRYLIFSLDRYPSG